MELLLCPQTAGACGKHVTRNHLQAPATQAPDRLAQITGVTSATMMATSHSEIETNSRELLETIGFLSRILIPAIAVLGILGNAVTLLVLLQRRLVVKMHRHNQSAHQLMTALAGSDLAFCAFVLPVVFLPRVFENGTAQLFFGLYGLTLVNVFITSSTYLTMITSIERCIVITQPLRAKVLLNFKRIKSIISLVFIFSILLNVPSLFRYKSVPLQENPMANMTKTFLQVTYQRNYHALRTIYRSAIWLLVGITPTIVVALLTCYSATALRKNRTEMAQPTGSQSRRSIERWQGSEGAGTPKSINRSFATTTGILMTICLKFLFFVAPCDFLNQTLRLMGYKNHMAGFILAARIFNVTQLLAFSTNFFLYLALSSGFRRSFRDVCRLRWQFTSTAQPVGMSGDSAVTEMAAQPGDQADNPRSSLLHAKRRSEQYAGLAQKNRAARARAIRACPRSHSTTQTHTPHARYLNRITSL